MDPVVLIPARGQSKRIPRKNIAMLGGRPLIQWTIDVSKKLGLVACVSTEDQEIAQASESLGASVLMRPEELASDTATDNDVVTHYLEHFPAVERVLYLRPTTPFRDVSVLASAILALGEKNYTHASSLRSIHEMPESAFKCFRRDTDWGRLHPIEHGGRVYSDVPNQLCPKTYSPNGYVDIVLPQKVGFDTHNIFGHYIHGFVTEPVIELDTQEQWQYAEYLLEKGLV